MRWDGTSAPSNHRLAGNSPKPRCPLPTLSTLARRGAGTSSCQNAAAADRLPSGAGREEWTLAQIPEPSRHPASRVPAGLGGRTGLGQGTGTPLREGLRGRTPEALRVARGWQQHTEHGRTAPGCAGTEGLPAQPGSPVRPVALSRMVRVPSWRDVICLLDTSRPEQDGVEARAVFRGGVHVPAPLYSGIPTGILM